ncbi:hypothetical protein KAR91_77095 [Candidatus Pacearchaeota archaeon]|nr:hypothetical protein [Candidatus Pacearchaeota archaeon]
MEVALILSGITLMLSIVGFKTINDRYVKYVLMPFFGISSFVIYISCLYLIIK